MPHKKVKFLFFLHQGPAVGFTVPPADTELGKVIIFGFYFGQLLMF